MEQDLESLLPKKTWFTLKECAEIKGINYKTFCNKVYLQPNKGISDGSIGGRKCFHRSTVLKWLPLTDKDILEDQK